MQFSCPHCQTHYKVSRERLANRILKVRCKVCQNVLAVRDPQLKAVDRTAAYVGIGLGGAADPQALAAATAAQIHQHWYYAQDGRRHGPLPLDQLREEIAVGKVGKRAWLWCPAFETWVHASDVESLRVDLERASLRSTAVSAPEPAAPAAAVGLPPSRVGKFRTNPTMQAAAPVRNAVIRSDRLIRAEIGPATDQSSSLPPGVGAGADDDDDIDFALPSEPTEIVDRELHRQLLQEADLPSDGWSPEVPSAGAAGVLTGLDGVTANQSVEPPSRAQKPQFIVAQEVVARHPEPGQRGSDDSDEIDLGDLWGDDESFGVPLDPVSLHVPDLPESPDWSESDPFTDPKLTHLSNSSVSEDNRDLAGPDPVGDEPEEPHGVQVTDREEELVMDPAAFAEREVGSDPGVDFTSGDSAEWSAVEQPVITDQKTSELSSLGEHSPQISAFEGEKDISGEKSVQSHESGLESGNILDHEPEDFSPKEGGSESSLEPVDLSVEPVGGSQHEKDAQQDPIRPLSNPEGIWAATDSTADDFTVMDTKLNVDWLESDEVQKGIRAANSDDEAQSGIAPTENNLIASPSKPVVSDSEPVQTLQPNLPPKLVARSRDEIPDILDTTAVREFDAVFAKERDEDDFVVTLAREADGKRQHHRELTVSVPDMETLTHDLPLGDTKALVSSDEEHAFFAEIKDEVEPANPQAEPQAAEIRESKQMLKTLAAEIKAEQPLTEGPRLHAHEDSTVFRMESAKKRKIAVIVAVLLLVLGAIVLWLAAQSSSEKPASGAPEGSTGAQIAPIVRPVYEIPKKEEQTREAEVVQVPESPPPEAVMELEPIEPDEQPEDGDPTSAQKSPKRNVGTGQKGQVAPQHPVAADPSKLDAAQLAALTHDRAEVVVSGGTARDSNKNAELAVVVDDRLIGEMFNKRSREMIRCAEKGKVVGKMVISFRVATNGVIENIQVTSPGGPIPREASQCIHDVIVRWKFPEQKKPYQFSRVLMLNP